MNTQQLFYRVEHSEMVNVELLKYSKNCLTLVKTKKNFECPKAIHYGPWGLLDYFTSDEVIYMASISSNHALPFYKKDRPFDSEINEIVMGPGGKNDNLIKEYFIFGCASRQSLFDYFPSKYREILNSHGFHMGVYSSNNVHTSKYQSVMNVDKTYEYVGSENLV